MLRPLALDFSCSLIKDAKKMTGHGSRSGGGGGGARTMAVINVIPLIAATLALLSMPFSCAADRRANGYSRAAVAAASAVHRRSSGGGVSGGADVADVTVDVLPGARTLLSTTDDNGTRRTHPPSDVPGTNGKMSGPARLSLSRIAGFVSGVIALSVIFCVVFSFGGNTVCCVPLSRTATPLKPKDLRIPVSRAVANHYRRSQEQRTLGERSRMQEDRLELNERRRSSSVPCVRRSSCVSRCSLSSGQHIVNGRRQSDALQLNLSTFVRRNSELCSVSSLEAVLSVSDAGTNISADARLAGAMGPRKSLGSLSAATAYDMHRHLSGSSPALHHNYPDDDVTTTAAANVFEGNSNVRQACHTTSLPHFKNIRIAHPPPGNSLRTPYAQSSAASSRFVSDCFRGNNTSRIDLPHFNLIEATPPVTVCSNMSRTTPTRDGGCYHPIVMETSPVIDDDVYYIRRNSCGSGDEDEGTKAAAVTTMLRRRNSHSDDIPSEEAALVGTGANNTPPSSQTVATDNAADNPPLRGASASGGFTFLRRGLSRDSQHSARYDTDAGGADSGGGSSRTSLTGSTGTAVAYRDRSAATTATTTAAAEAPPAGVGDMPGGGIDVTWETSNALPGSFKFTPSVTTVQPPAALTNLPANHNGHTGPMANFKKQLSSLSSLPLKKPVSSLSSLPVKKQVSSLSSLPATPLRPLALVIRAFAKRSSSCGSSARSSLWTGNSIPDGRGGTVPELATAAVLSEMPVVDISSNRHPPPLTWRRSDLTDCNALLLQDSVPSESMM